MTTATSLNELQQQIRDRYDSLSKRLQQVSRYVLDNTNSVAFDTVAVIAERADVPPSTLIRFANAFDFTGFNEMKQLFRMNLVEETASYSDRARLFREMESEAVPETPLDILQEFARSNAQALQQLAARAEPEMLERAVQLLADADTIYIAGLRRSFSVAAYLTYALSHLECRPILLDGIAPGMELYTEESFGPVCTLERVKDDEEAVTKANDSVFGLSAAVFSRDIGRAMALAQRIESGICHINSATVDDEAPMPFGGVKDSGYGRFGSQASINEFTELRWITMRSTPKHYPI